MKQSLELEKNVGTRILTAITLACYSGALAALLALSYSLLVLVLRACEQNILAIYSSQCF